MSTLALAGLLLLGVGCTDPTIIGGELLDEEDLPIEYTDTLDLEFTTLRLEPSPAGDIQGLGSTAGVAAVSFGCLDDPIFGTTEASIAFELIVVDDRDSLDGLLQLTPDSAILTVPLAPAFQVGRDDAAVNLRVVGAEPGTVDLTEAITSDSFGRTGVEYATFTGVPPRDSVDVEVFSRGGTSETVRRGPLLRIPLDQAALEIAALEPARDQLSASDEEDMDSPLVDSTFTQAFGGFILEHDPSAACVQTLPALDLSAGRLPELGVTVYVTQLNGDVAEYRLALRRTSAATTANLRPAYTHEYAGSPVADALENGLADGRGFLQGTDGIGLELSLPNPAASATGALAVNYAVLDLPIVRDGFAEPVDFLDVQVRNSVGDLERTDGLGPLLVEGRDDAIFRVAAYGSATDSVDVYRFNVTEYLQGVAVGNREAAIVLLPQNANFVAGRSIINVDDDGELPAARLLLATTELP